MKKQIGKVFDATEIAKKVKEEKCLHDDYNQSLVDSGKAETIAEAARMPRYLHCPCKRCNPFYF